MVVTDTNQPTSSASEMPTPTNNSHEPTEHGTGHSSVQNTPVMGPLQQSNPRADINDAGSMNLSFPPGKQPYQSQHANFTTPSQTYGVSNEANVSSPHDPRSVPHTPGNQETITRTQPQSPQNNGGLNQPQSNQKTEKCGSCSCHKLEKAVDTAEPKKASQLNNEAPSYPSHFNPGSNGPFEGHALGWKQEGVSSSGNLAPVQDYPVNTVQAPTQSAMSGFQMHRPQPTSAHPQATYALQNNAYTSNNFGPQLSGQYLPPGSEHRIGAPSIFSYDPAHNCNCGDGCQCLGCASHPYNNTTRQHIQEMGYMMSMGEDDANHERSRSRGHTLYDEQMSPGGPPQFPTFRDNSLDFAQPPGTEHLPILPGSVATPRFEHGSTNPGSPYDSGYNQMMMQPSAYYTVEYPVGDLNPCMDMTGTCQCGSDCSCVGCLTHSGHNGLSLGPTPQPNPTNPPTPSGHPVQSGVPYVSPQEHMSPSDYPLNSSESQKPVDPNTV